MKSMKKQSIILVFAIVLLSISMGYALIYGDLKLQGIAVIKKQTWDVHFENIQVEEGSKTPVSPATIDSNDPTKVSYNIYLENPGDYYEFTVDAVNDGSIDAMITNISITNNDSPLNLPSYVSYSVTYESDKALAVNQLLAANTRETYKLRIEFKKDITASDLANISELNLNIKFKVTYSQEENGEETGNIKVAYDTAGGILRKSTNLIGNLPETPETVAAHMTYSIHNNVVTVTADNYDGYGYTNITVNLKEGKTYYFSCDTDGTWSSTNTQNTVEAYLMPENYVNASQSYYIQLESNDNYEFTPTQTSTYTLRLDVNKQDKVNIFSNIRIYEAVTNKKVSTGNAYGKLPTPKKDGYLFVNWESKDNLISDDKTDWESGGVNINGDKITSTKRLRLKEDLKISPSTEYTISTDDNQTVGIRLITFYDSNHTYISNRQSLLGSKTIEFTSPANAAYMQVALMKSDGTETGEEISVDDIETALPHLSAIITNTTIVSQTADHTIKATWIKAEATFVTGREFNGIIKRKAGDTNGIYATANTSITSIKRYTDTPSSATLASADVVSTQDSYVPIYVWYTNGTIYYYTRATKLYMNPEAMDMFQYLTNAKTIDVKTMDTSKVTNMQGLFNLDSSLEELDLSNFNTSNVETMYAMFKDCSSLESLNLGSFDMSAVTNVNQFIYYDSSLTALKTPKVYPTGTSITLPVTMYDGSTPYSSLDSNSPTETWLSSTSS